MNDVYEHLMSVLNRHLTPANAKSVLNRAVRPGVSRMRPPTDEELPEIVLRVQRAAAAYTTPARQKALTDDLQRLWKREQVEPVSVEITAEQHIVDARSNARRMCGRLGTRRMTSQKVATIVSELARNIVLYTPGGTIELIPKQSPSRIVVVARDRGKGIPNLDEIMGGRYRSRTGLGCGLLGTKRVADSFQIKTGPAGTCVEAAIFI
jgi:serine/threonine-protein kinase RsbT